MWGIPAEAGTALGQGSQLGVGEGGDEGLELLRLQELDLVEQQDDASADGLGRLAESDEQARFLFTSTLRRFADLRNPTSQ